jgi:protein involved in polysaccharide export with SLBB domain
MVYVIGQVTSPRELVLRDQLTLHRAILYAGGVQARANTSQVHVYRLKEGQASPVTLTYNYSEIKKGKAPDVVLQANDVIEVGTSGGVGQFMKDMLRSMPSQVMGRALIF